MPSSSYVDPAGGLYLQVCKDFGRRLEARLFLILPALEGSFHDMEYIGVVDGFT